jgi:transcriptional regulator with XRE-family HTH domain
MKQSELAQRLGISKSYLSMMLSGKRAIPETMKQPLSELCEQFQLQNPFAKEEVASSNLVFRSIFFPRCQLHLNPEIWQREENLLNYPIKPPNCSGGKLPIQEDNLL